MNISDITTLITTVGFPIFVAVFFMLTANKAIAEVTKAVEKQTIVLEKQTAAIEKLCEKISNMR